MQKIISKIIVLIYTVVMITSLAACHKEEETKLPQQLYTSVIIADFSNGAIDSRESSLKEKNVEMNRQPTIGELASVLGQWVGLDFALNEFKIEGEKAYVDWAINSTLVAGLGERKQKEEFFFDDASSLNWFMMDSLARTIKANFPVNKVYYSQGGGNLLTFSQGQEIGFNALPLEQSYEGSAFFIAQSSLSKEKSSPVTYTPEAKPENYDFPITDVPVYSPDILRLRNASYGEMPTFDNQNDVARYVLYQFFVPLLI